MSSISAGLPAVPLYLADAADESQNVASFQASDPQTKSDAAYFQQVAPSLTTPDALLGNYRALSVVLGAFGVSSSIGSTAMLKQLMTQDPTSSTSLAQKMGNAALLRFATAMNGFNPPPFGNSGDVTATVQAYATNQYEQSQDQLSPGLQDALYFNRNIGGVTSIDQLMTDPKLLQVAVTSIGLDPTAYGQLDFSQQQQVLTQKIDLADFTDPKKVTSMVTSYLVRQGAGQTGATSTASMALSLLNGSVDSSGAGLLGALFGSGGTSAANILTSLYSSSGSSGPDPMLQLFA